MLLMRPPAVYRRSLILRRIFVEYNWCSCNCSLMWFWKYELKTSHHNHNYGCGPFFKTLQLTAKVWCYVMCFELKYVVPCNRLEFRTIFFLSLLWISSLFSACRIHVYNSAYFQFVSWLNNFQISSGKYTLW